MFGSMQGTHDEVARIRRLLLNNSFKMDSIYRVTWENMSDAEAKDAQYHCTITSKMLHATKIASFTALYSPKISAPSLILSIPSLAFVAIKIYKTFDMKLRKLGRRNLNRSHVHDWVAYVEEINDYISGNIQGRTLQILYPHILYRPLSAEELISIRGTRTAQSTTFSLPLSVPPVTMTTTTLLTSPIMNTTWAQWAPWAPTDRDKHQAPFSPFSSFISLFHLQLPALHPLLIC